MPSIDKYTSVTSIYDRQTFKNTPQFTLTMMSALLGMENFGRFPFVAYYNGQFAFIVAYIIINIFIIRPVLYLEMCLGQFSGKGNIKTFRSLGHVFSGIGMSQAITILFNLAAVGSQLAFFIFYFSQSFHYVLPWSYCRQEYGPTCYNDTSHANKENLTSSARYYFKYVVLREKNEQHHNSFVHTTPWDSAIALFCAYILSFMVLSTGLDSMSKVNSFIGTLPIIMLFVMMVESCKLPGAMNGIKNLMYPQWEKLLDVKIWINGCIHALNSLTLGAGTNMMYASYNPISTDLGKVSWFLCILDVSTSIMGACTLYATIGYMVEDFDKDVMTSLAAGEEIWVIYSKIVINFQKPYILSTMFFFMFLTLGLGTVVANQELIITQYTDYNPGFFKNWHLSGMSAIIGFSFGLIFITPKGRHISKWVEFVIHNIDIEICSWLTVICVCYGYGMRKFCWDIEYMTDNYPDIICRISWRICPFFILACSIIFSKSVGKVTAKDSRIWFLTETTGWIVVGGILSPVIIWPIVDLIRNRKLPVKKNIEFLLEPDQWEPIHEPINYKRFIYFKEEDMEVRPDKKKPVLRLFNDFFASNITPKAERS